MSSHSHSSPGPLSRLFGRLSGALRPAEDDSLRDPAYDPGAAPREMVVHRLALLQHQASMGRLTKPAAEALTEDFTNLLEGEWMKFLQHRFPALHHLPPGDQEAVFVSLRNIGKRVQRAWKDVDWADPDASYQAVQSIPQYACLLGEGFLALQLEGPRSANENVMRRTDTEARLGREFLELISWIATTRAAMAAYQHGPEAAAPALYAAAYAEYSGEPVERELHFGTESVPVGKLAPLAQAVRHTSMMQADSCAIVIEQYRQTAPTLAERALGTLLRTGRRSPETEARELVQQILSAHNAMLPAPLTPEARAMVAPALVSEAAERLEALEREIAHDRKVLDQAWDSIRNDPAMRSQDPNDHVKLLSRFKPLKAHAMTIDEMVQQGVPVGLALYSVFEPSRLAQTGHARTHDSPEQAQKRDTAEQYLVRVALGSALAYSRQSSGRSDDYVLGLKALDGQRATARAIQHMLDAFGAECREHLENSDAELMRVGRFRVQRLVREGVINATMQRDLDASLERAVSRARAYQETLMWTGVYAQQGRIDATMAEGFATMPYAERYAQQLPPARATWEIDARNRQNLDDLFSETLDAYTEMLEDPEILPSHLDLRAPVTAPEVFAPHADGVPAHQKRQYEQERDKGYTRTVEIGGKVYTRVEAPKPNPQQQKAKQQHHRA